MPWDGACRATVHLSDHLPTAASGVRVSSVERWRPNGGAVQQPRFAPDGARACVHDGSGWLNVYLDGEPVAAGSLRARGSDVGDGPALVRRVTRRASVAFNRNESGFGRLCVADRSTGAVTELGRGVHGRSAGWARHDRRRCGPGHARRRRSCATTWQRAAARSRRRSGRRLGHLELPEPELVEVAHDGVVLHARRYAAGAGRMLVWVHGGPTDQWQVDFRPRIAYWWSRGWDVLVVDPRGTTGHGRAYQRALNGQWGRLDVDDTAAMIRHAHRQGWGSPATTALIGGSSGGLTVLGRAGRPRRSRRRRRRVVSGQRHRRARLSPPIASRRTTPTRSSGRPRPGTAARYHELSPIHRADRITKPLLVFHGTDDPVVPIGQSETLVDTIAADGGAVELVVYDGEGHGFRDPLNQRDEYERTERFLAAPRPSRCDERRARSTARSGPSPHDSRGGPADSVRIVAFVNKRRRRATQRARRLR